MRPGSPWLFCGFWFQLEAFEVNVSPDLQQQLVSVVQELGVSIPPPVGIWFQTPLLVSFLTLILILL